MTPRFELARPDFTLATAEPEEAADGVVEPPDGWLAALRARCSAVGAVLVFAGFNGTFFIQFIAGSLGMPRRYADYDPQFFKYHLVSTLGSYLLTAGLVIVLINWIKSLKSGPKAPQNPWGANTLEWHTPSPPPHENFTYDPQAVQPYDYDGWDYDEATDGYTRKENYVEPEGH